MAADASDAADFRRLFDGAYRPLLAYALRRGATHVDAEEVVAETRLVARLTGTGPHSGRPSLAASRHGQPLSRER
jgi:hypothetical protein